MSNGPCKSTCMSIIVWTLGLGWDLYSGQPHTYQWPWAHRAAEHAPTHMALSFTTTALILFSLHNAHFVQALHGTLRICGSAAHLSPLAP